MDDDMFEENREQRIAFSMSLLWFWIKGYATITSKAVEFSTPNLIFRIIPAGRKSQMFTFWNIVDVVVDTRYKGGQMLIGVLLIVGGCLFGAVADEFIWCILWGIGLFVTGIQSSLCVRLNRVDGDYMVYVPFYAKRNLLAIQKALRSRIT